MVFHSSTNPKIRGGDAPLENHLKTTSANSTYISKTTQNNIIKCCGKKILSNIKRLITQSKYYSIMFDESTDTSTISQMSIVIRYVCMFEVGEDFIGFLACMK